MTSDQIAGIVRHLLTALGGIVIAKGYADEATVTQLIGFGAALAATVWSIRSKREPQA